ncbi:MAG: hypothetical protein OSJ53_06985 [Kineothrix sp.]|nr:hypothetical protein [Kineothrix sp.]
MAKISSILRKRNRLEAYRFIEQHNKEFGVRWLLRRFGLGIWYPTGRAGSDGIHAYAS